MAEEAAATAVNGSSEKVANGLPEESPEEQQTSIFRLFLFYLGDANLPFDEFLFKLSQERLSESERLERPGTGWIEISRIATFKRMQPYSHFTAEQIADILREKAAPAIEVDEKGERIRRAEPISLERSSGQVDRSIYAKGFPTDEDEHLQLRIERFFQRYHQTNAVRMRRENAGEGRKAAKGKFKGSVFVEFATKQDKDAFLASDPLPTFPGQEKPLEVLPKREYLDKKAEEHNVTADHKDQHRSKFNAFTQLKYLSKGKNAQGESPRKRTIDYRDVELDVENGKVANPDAIPVKEDDHEYILRFTGTSDVEFASLKEKLAPVSEVAFIETNSRDADSFVSFKEKVTDEDLEAIQKLDLEGRDGNKFEWHKATAEDAKSYHLRRASFHARRADHVDKTSRDSRDGGRGGRGGGRGRGRGGRGAGGGSRHHDSKPYDRKGGPRKDREHKQTQDGQDIMPEIATSGQLKRKAEGEGDAEAKKPKTEEAKTEV